MAHGAFRRLGLLLFCLAPIAAQAAEPASLDGGYRLMYNFDFDAAGRELGRWTAEHPGDPLGPVSQGANLLVSELSRLGILQAQFFVDDASFTTNRWLQPDEAVRARLESALGEASRLADARLKRDASDRDALFATALVAGLHADYAALIEQRSLAALSYTRDAARSAARLLALAPDYADARLATGTSEYIVGSLAAPIRWILRLGGYSGNKAVGIAQLRITAQHGRLLAPLARILLSIAYLRGGERAHARDMLAGLLRDFPTNPLFASEVRRLDKAKGD
jgi:hypothetical protein